jgi:hypothetical protein
MDPNKVTTQRLQAFVGGQLEHTRPRIHNCLRGEIVSAEIQEEGRDRIIVVTLAWSATGDGSQFGWERSDELELRISLFAYNDVHECSCGNILSVSCPANNTSMRFYPPDYRGLLDRSKVRGL